VLKGLGDGECGELYWSKEVRSDMEKHEINP
jgi:hypothetical protein